MWRVWGEETHAGVWWGNLKERDYLEHLCLEARIILKCILKIGWNGVDCVDLPEDGTSGGIL
jgi:hypothetical protein